MTAWSYSSLSTFKQCPKKYYHLRIAKDVKDASTQALRYGNEVHKAAELYIRDGVPIPKKFDFILKSLDALNKIEGDKHCELKFGVSYDGENYSPCKFFDKEKEVWWRGIADLVIVNKDKAYLVDYKTGKNARYADTAQLDALAAATFLHFPEVQTIKSALLYVVSNDFIRKEHTREFIKSYFAGFHPDLDRLAVAEESNVWNAVSGPLCAYCPVTKCPHNRRG
jgi:hypothetical protein